jgi:hypothetical protein
MASLTAWESRTELVRRSTAQEVAPSATHLATDTMGKMNLAVMFVKRDPLFDTSCRFFSEREWKNGVYHGRGALTKADGSIRADGFWRNGKFNEDDHKIRIADF